MTHLTTENIPIIMVLFSFYQHQISVKFQLRIVAYDSANPAQKATALVTIAVTRNENAPRFRQNRYTLSMVETAALGSSVQQVEATDADGVSKKRITFLHV